MSIRYLDLSGAVNFWTNIKNFVLSKIPTKTSELTNDSGYLTSHQSLSNYVTLNTAQEITNTKTFKDANTVRKLTSVEAGNVIPSSDKLISDIWQDKNGKELGRIYYVKSKSGTTELIMRAGDWFTSNEGVYTLDASGTNRRAELHLYSDANGNCCIKPVGYFSTTLKPLNSSVLLGEYGNSFGSVYANQFRMSNPSLEPNVDVSANEEHSIGFFGKNNGPLSYITFQKRPSFKDRVAIRIQTSSSAYKSYDFDATCFYPESNNSVDIGSTTNIFKNIYCNNYYKGTTAFGDIVTHNASEFLTSHQSLSSCVKNSVVNSQTIKSTDITRGTAPSSAQTFGIVFSDNNNKYIGNIYGQYATNKSTYVGLYAYKGTTTSNSDNVSVRVGYDASGNAYTYAPTPATADNSTQIATTAFVKAQGYLTSHQSLANYVTTNTDQDITGNKNFKDLITTSGPTLWTIDTKTTDDITFLHNNAVHVEQRASGNLTDLSGGAWNIANLGIGCFFFRINNGTDIRYKNLAQNTVNRIPVVSNANRFINDVTPNENNTYSLGTSSLQWKNAYAVNFYENGTALSDKYLTVSAISGGASTSAGNITPVKGTIISGFAESDSVTYSTNFGGVLTSPSHLFYATCVYDTSNSTMTYYKGPSVGGTGTWKLMGGGVPNPGSSTKLLFGLWVKIV